VLLPLPVRHHHISHAPLLATAAALPPHCSAVRTAAAADDDADSSPQYLTKAEILPALDPANAEPKDVAAIIQAATPELRADKDVMRVALDSAGPHVANVLKLASETVRGDRDFIYGLITGDYGRFHAILKHATPAVAADRDVVWAAVRQSCWAYRWASDDLKADRELAMYAVTQKSCGGLLGDVSRQLVGEPGSFDEELVLAAIGSACDAFERVEELKSDRELALAAVKLRGDCIEQLSPELKADREIVAAAVADKGYQLMYADDTLHNDTELIIGELVGAGAAAYGVLGMVPWDLRGHREIIAAAVKEHGHCLKYADDELKDDEEIVLEAVRKTNMLLLLLSPVRPKSRNAFNFLDLGYGPGPNVHAL
jgi:hypothetical protein